MPMQRSAARRSSRGLEKHRRPIEPAELRRSPQPQQMVEDVEQTVDLRKRQHRGAIVPRMEYGERIERRDGVDVLVA